MKRLSIGKHLVNIPNCANNIDKTKFKILRKCTNFFDLIKLEILIHLYKHKLNKHKVFEYTISLFN